jgi:hypothetical protein
VTDSATGGSFIVFTTGENIQATQPPPSAKQVYRFSRAAGGDGSLDICSVDNNGVFAALDCINPDVSDSGKVVCFSTAAALVPNDNNNVSDIYVRDFRQNPPVTTLVS